VLDCFITKRDSDAEGLGSALVLSGGGEIAARSNFYSIWQRINRSVGEYMARLGREFEKLVARIEENLGPAGAIVASPDKIEDRVTGKLREVDVSIRCTVGSVPILITVECRDRTAAQDITWLEQIKAKKEGIAANQTIVVSKEGFTEGAKVYARHHGIILRQMFEVTDAFWLQCVQGLKVFVRDIRCRMVTYNIGFFPHVDDKGLEQLPITDHVVSAIQENRPFATNRAGEKLTLEELYSEALPMIQAELAHRVDSGKGFNSEELIEGCVEVDALFEPSDITVETERGTRYVQVIIFGIKYEIKNDLLPPLKPMQYTDENGQLIDSFSMTSDPNSTAKVRIKFGWDQK